MFNAILVLAELAGPLLILGISRWNGKSWKQAVAYCCIGIVISFPLAGLRSTSPGNCSFPVTFGAIDYESVQETADFAGSTRGRFSLKNRLGWSRFIPRLAMAKRR